MKKDYQKEYIDISTEFRNSNHSQESLAKLFDLLYELEKDKRTKNEELILSNIYTLLGSHQSAYDTYKQIVDLTNRKETKKLYVLEQKSKSHGNNFITKDIRKLRAKKEEIKLLPSDFEFEKNDHNNSKYILKDKDIVIFNKILKYDKLEVYIYEKHKFKNYITKIIDYIDWLKDCQNLLISFYNSKLSEYTQDKANKDWYDTLDVFKLSIIVGQKGKLFAEITGGDEFMSDHILHIEIEENKITEMSYDG